MAPSDPDFKGITFSEAFFLMLVCCKITNQIDWSWWWIASPLWGNLIGNIIISVITKRKP